MLAATVLQTACTPNVSQKFIPSMRQFGRDGRRSTGTVSFLPLYAMGSLANDSHLCSVPSAVLIPPTKAVLRSPSRFTISTNAPPSSEQFAPLSSSPVIRSPKMSTTACGLLSFARFIISVLMCLNSGMFEGLSTYCEDSAPSVADSPPARFPLAADRKDSFGESTPSDHNDSRTISLAAFCSP